MNDDFQLKLQAFFDGELPADEAAEVKRSLEQDADGRALLAELQNTRTALAGQDEGVKLPESREFFWSKIERQIQREEATPAPAQKSTWWRWTWRALVPVSGLALVCLLMLRPGNPAGAAGFAPELELASSDMGAYTYRDQQDGLTAIWLYDRTSETPSTASTVTQ